METERNVVVVKDEPTESADTTGRWKIAELKPKYPDGLKIRVSSARYLTEKGKRAMENGVVEVAKVE